MSVSWMASGGDASVPDGSEGKLFPLNFCCCLSEPSSYSFKFSVFGLYSSIITVFVLLCTYILFLFLRRFPLKKTGLA